MSDDMAATLRSYLAAHWPDPLDPVVHDLRSISIGWESDVYAFDLEHGPEGERRRHPLVLRIYSGDVAKAKSAREFHGMSLLGRAGYPVPAVHLLEQEASPFGQPFVIMDRVDGTPMWPVLFGSDEEHRKELLTQFCTLQVELHRLNWRPLVPDPARYDDNPYAAVDRALNQLCEWIEQDSLTDYRPAHDWLVARRDRAACRHPAVVHLDFHPENVLLRPNGSVAVIDWTQVTVSDPRFDLASTLVLIGSIMGDAWRGRVLAEYERVAGAPTQELPFFETFSCLRRLLLVAIVVHHGPEKLGLRGDVRSRMQRQRKPLRRVYDRLAALTGLRVPDIENLLQSFE